MGYPRRVSKLSESVVLEVIARDRADVLRRLFQLYAHDFSEHMALSIRDDGLFDVEVDERWWTSPDRHPFFIRVDGMLSGFALAARGSRITGDPNVMDVAELFVVRGARRRSVGGRAAQGLFERFPGPWEVRVRKSNADALPFWTRVVREASGRDLAPLHHHEEGVAWDVFQFEPRSPR